MANDKSFKIKNGLQAGRYLQTGGTETAGTESYRLGSASYDSVSFSAASQDTTPRGLNFNNDGTKMYILGGTNDTIYQYSLSTAFDLSTASYDSVSFSVSSQDTTPHDIVFNNDGTKMYVLIFTTDTLYQYSLTTAWDVSTASYDNVSFSFSSQDSVPYSFTMTPDGTKIIMQGNSNFSIFQYSLSTAFDLSTISYDNVSLSAAVDHFSNGRVRFGQNGEKMFMKGGNNVYQYSLSTAYDISTGSYDNVSFDVSSQVSTPIAFAFDLSGTKMYAVGLGNTKVHQYTLSTAFDISTASYDNVTLNYASQVSKGGAMTFSQSGHKFYMTSDNTDTVYQYSTGL